MQRLFCDGYAFVMFGMSQLNADEPPAQMKPTTTAAHITPQHIAGNARLNLMSSRDATSVPVHAPRVGRDENLIVTIVLLKDD